MTETRRDKRQKEKAKKRIARVKELQKNKEGYAAGPLVLGFFLFVLGGSMIFQTIGMLTKTGSG